MRFFHSKYVKHIVQAQIVKAFLRIETNDFGYATNALTRPYSTLMPNKPVPSKVRSVSFKRSVLAQEKRCLGFTIFAWWSNFQQS